MAKPIFVVNIETVTPLTKEEINKKHEELNRQMGEDYHILFFFKLGNKTDIQCSCFNDCKGLPDGSIEEIINKFNKELNKNG